MLMSILGFLTSITGIIGFFCDIQWLMIIGFLVYVIETISGLITGELKSLTTTIITILISSIVSINTSYNIFYGICFGICIESFILSLLGLPMLLWMIRRK